MMKNPGIRNDHPQPHCKAVAAASEPTMFPAKTRRCTEKGHYVLEFEGIANLKQLQFILLMPSPTDV